MHLLVEWLKDKEKKLLKLFRRYNISVEKAIELFDRIRDLRVQDVKDKTTSFEDKINIENHVTQQLAEQIKEENETGNKLHLEEM